MAPYRESQKPESEDVIQVSSDKPFFVFMLITISKDEDATWHSIGINAKVTKDNYMSNDLRFFDTCWVMAQNKWEGIHFALTNFKDRFPKVMKITIEDTKAIGLEDFGWFKHQNLKTRLAALYSHGGQVQEKFFYSEDKYLPASTLPVQINRLALVTKADLEDFQARNIPNAPYVFVDSSR